MAITDKDIKKLGEIFATKDDLTKFATKDDLTKFVTKEDAGQAEQRANNRHNEIMTTLDALMKEKETAGQERILALGKDREQDRKIGDLEVRVQKVEAKVG